MKQEHKLQILRNAHRLTQTQMAKMLHLSQEAYGRLERGYTEMTIERANQLAAIFNVDPTVFTTDVDIVVVIGHQQQVQVFSKHEFEQLQKANPVPTDLVQLLRTCIKEEVENALQSLKAKSKKPRKLKALWWLLVNSTLTALQLSDELLPVLVD